MLTPHATAVPLLQVILPGKDDKPVFVSVVVDAFLKCLILHILSGIPAGFCLVPPRVLQVAEQI